MRIPVAIPDGGPRRLDEDGLQPRGPVTDSGRPPLARAFIEARTQAHPGPEVARGRKPFHVDPNLRDQRLCDDMTDAGHGA